MKRTKFSLCLAVASLLPWGATVANAQDPQPSKPAKGIQTIRVIQGEGLPQGQIQVEGKKLIVVDKDGKQQEIEIPASGSLSITQSTEETNKDGKVDRKVTGKAIIIGPNGEKQEIELDGGGFVLGNQGMPGGFQFQPRMGLALTSKFFIGVHCEPVDEETRAKLRLAEKAGLQVLEVSPESPAEAAGLKSGDILLYANDTELGTREQLIEVVQKVGEASEELALSIVRDGKEEKVVVRPAERPAMPMGEGGMPIPGIGNLDLDIDMFGGPEGAAPDIDALRKQMQEQMEQMRVQIFPNGPEGGMAIPMPGIIRGLPEGLDAEQMKEIQAEMAEAKQQLAQARAEMEKAQKEISAELKRAQAEIREQMQEAKKEIQKAIEELRKSRDKGSN